VSIDPRPAEKVVEEEEDKEVQGRDAEVLYAPKIQAEPCLLNKRVRGQPNSFPSGKVRAGAIGVAVCCCVGNFAGGGVRD